MVKIILCNCIHKVLTIVFLSIFVIFLEGNKMLNEDELSVSDHSEGLTDSLLLISSPQVNCRATRPPHWINEWGAVKQHLSYFIRFFLWSSGYNKPIKVLSRIYSFLVFLVCWYQVVYEIARTLGCSNFVCSSQVVNSTTRMEWATYSSASIASALSYTCMLNSLFIIYAANSNSISPYVGLKDMSNSKARVTLLAMLFSVSIFVSYVSIFGYIAYDSKRHSVLDIVSVTCEFIAQWVGTVSVYAFACSSFAVGAFASDTLRRIHLSNGNFDEMIRIHRELRTIVKHTTSAYSLWFLFHWLIFGVTAIIGFVVVALYKFGEDPILRKIYFGIFFGLHIFHFIFPCVCAAYITTVCASITAKINNTTSEDWQEGHIFRERSQLQMFVSYCTVSPICFKIGRITFTSTLAWCSFIFGSFGLVFHFFT